MTVLATIPLLREFFDFLTSGQDPTGAVAPHVHAEFNFPNTYFAIEGNVAFKTLRDEVSEDDWRFTVERAEPTRVGSSSRARTRRPSQAVRWCGHERCPS